MTGITITRVNLSRAIYKALEFSKGDSKKIMKLIIKEFMKGLKKDGILKIARFGSFRVLHKSQRMGRNPKTGEPRVVTARDVAVFKKSPHLLKEF